MKFLSLPQSKNSFRAWLDFDFSESEGKLNFEQSSHLLPLVLKVAQQGWADRLRERGLPETQSLWGGCKFASLFVRALYGGELRGNWHHQFNVINGVVVDLAEDVQEMDALRASGVDAYGHDDVFWGNDEHLESMLSCVPRVNSWLERFSQARLLYEANLPDHLVIDDVPRPTTNSLGRPIHSTEEGIRNFWGWFGRSKFVDGQGRPLVVHHGAVLPTAPGRSGVRDRTNLPFDSFERSKWGGAFFFSPDFDWAKDFASEKASRTREGGSDVCVVSAYLKGESPFNPRDAGHVERFLAVCPPEIPVFNYYAGDIGETLSHEQARRVLAGRQSWTFVEANLELLKRAGFDSTHQCEREATYAVFSSSQIKSADRNSGRFDPETSSLSDSARRCELGVEHPGEYPNGVTDVIWRQSVLRALGDFCDPADRGRVQDMVERAKALGVSLSVDQMGRRLDGRLVDFSADEAWHDVAYRNPTPEVIQRLSKWLRANPDQIVRLYHGTSARHAVVAEGLKPTDRRRRDGAHSMQTRSGYVSLSIYPGMAETFARMAYPGERVAIYAVDVPVRMLVADADQLKNKRHFSEVACGNSLADSLCYGHGAQIKGAVEPWRITYVGSSGDLVRQLELRPESDSHGASSPSLNA